ncbi:hypothetical protein RRG08_006843 [Elysia crispata]|uniref:Uncharacterized protein n=1 Tax=Elysia crispata TaxID=231223 RepID=A0AAE0XWM8_9GAST|nr:hypothetical protein RRG08_006843 [Elysia crispata]
MISAEFRTSHHTPTPTKPNMLPAVLRPCCKGRLFSKVVGVLSLGAVLYTCLLLRQTGLSPGSRRQLRATGDPDSRDTDVYRNTIETRDDGNDDIAFLDFKQLSRNFTFTHRGVSTKGNLTAYFNLRLKRELMAMKEALLLHDMEMSRLPCLNFKSSQSKDVSPKLKVTLIYSLVGVDSIVDAVLFLRTNFEKIPLQFVDDVIVTVEEEAEEEYKAQVESLVDLCAVCRLFFFTGTIWEHRNTAVNFARGEILLFVDARVQPVTDNWVWSLSHALSSSPHLVVSPHLRLRGGDQGRDFSVGFTRNEMTWSLAVARGPISNIEISEAIRFTTTTNNRDSSHRSNILMEQTAIAKEVFAIRKSFFHYVGGFDIEKTATGGEHILFSLKVLNCGGNITVSLCSEVSLEIPNIAPSKPKYIRPLFESEKSLPPSRQKRLLESLRVVSHSENLSRQALYTVDFQNPSFFGQIYSTGLFFSAAQEIWMDPYSKRYSGCTIQPRLFGSRRMSKERLNVSAEQRSRNGLMNYNHRPSRQEPMLGARVKQQISKRKCATRNFRSVVAKRQPRMVSATKRATFYGYIRSADGLYAFGLSPAMSDEAILALASSKPVVPAVRSANGGRLEPVGISANSSLESSINTDQDLNLDTRFHIVLTRNSSEWIGPFSHTNGAFVYQHTLCLTLLPNNQLSLRKCLKGTREQLFVYSAHTIKSAGLADEWACAKLPRLGEGTSRTSPTVMGAGPVFMARCLGDGQGSMFAQFKMDVRFKDHCVA